MDVVYLAACFVRDRPQVYSETSEGLLAAYCKYIISRSDCTSTHWRFAAQGRELLESAIAALHCGGLRPFLSA